MDIQNTLIQNKEVNNVRKTAEEMDEQRQRLLAYEYLCHLEEVKIWMESCLKEKLPSTTELEENLRNGVYLAKLAHFMSPKSLPLNKIYDIEQKRYAAAGLQFRHTDNINHFLHCLKTIQLPMTFQPETTDIYDKKNMPRVIYCIHALSTHLFKLGKASQIQDLYGKVSFTDDEIGAVSKELQKSGIQMPQFQKIGDLLTSSMSGNKNSLYAAVMAINEVLYENKMNDAILLKRLQNNAAQLNYVLPNYIKDYSQVLMKAKAKKIEALLNKSLNDSYVADAYDEIINQAEIQGHINCVNVQHALQEILKSVECEEADIIKALKVPTLNLQEILDKNADFYKSQLKLEIDSLQFKNNCTESNHYWINLLQNIVNTANKIAIKEKKREEALNLLNISLQTQSISEFCKIIKDPDLGLNSILDDFALPLYYEELKIDCMDGCQIFSCDDIIVSLGVLTVIAGITKAIDTGNPDLVYEALKNPRAFINDVHEENKIKYYRELTRVRNKKLNSECPILSYTEIQECVDIVNFQSLKDIETIQALRRLYLAVIKGTESDVLTALQDKILNLKIPVSSDNVLLYMKLLNKCLMEHHSDGSLLWLEDIERITKFILTEIKEIKDIMSVLNKINTCLEDETIFTYLENLGFTLPKSKVERYKLYVELKKLHKIKKEKYKCPIIRYVTTQGSESFLKLEDCTFTWNSPTNLSESYYITKDDITKLMKNERTEKLQDATPKMNENTVIRFQACIRGYMLRKKVSSRLIHYYNNLQKIIKIQAWWRSIIQQKKFKKLIDNERMTNINNYLKKALKGSNIEDTLDSYREHENHIIKIQTLWRGRMVRRAFNSILRSEKPPFPVVKYFSGILNFNAEDYDKDLQLQHLKHEVVQIIKYNQNLSQQLDSMDVKIGLLIQNRISLHDVAVHGKSLETLAKQKDIYKESKTLNVDNTIMSYKGLKSLTRDGRKMLESYQHLFYALQTNPSYFSKLLFLLPHSKTNRFLQNVIFTLFNFGSNIREEYLLLKLFATALQEEIKSNFRKPAEIVTGNPLALKMIINYARQVKNGQRALRRIVGPIIEKVMADRSLCIETNPADIYKCWRNQLETDTGEVLKLPYSVTPRQALKYSQVRKRLNKGIELLRKTVAEFLDTICKSRDLIPYGMLYIAKVLHDSISQKFPNAPEKDVLKVVGNFIYYHYINAAIVAPDAFDIITLPIDKSLSNDQRRNLASIAKILQFAASKKGFGEEASHLICLNPFIIECHEKFKNFFRHCCQIEGLEEHFSIHEFTEATLIRKPEIIITVKEMCDTHCLLLEYQNQIAPDPMDVLHDLLEDLGPNPTVASLLGISEPVCESNLIRFGKMEVCLILTNKFEVPENEDTNLHKLFIKTKELLVSVLQFLKGQTLITALESTCSPVQQRLYDAKCSSIMNTLNIIQHSSSLNDCKQQLRAYLNKLELGGWVSQKDGYQNIITAVAKDLCNKGKYRQMRNRELETLKATKKSLEKKTEYYKEQVEFYNEYIKQCRENLNAGKKSYRGNKTPGKNNHGKLMSKMTLKYSALKLQEKGILLKIDGLTHSQLKNVIFEISPTENSGIFLARCKFMGVEMEKVEIDIQKLLELQYEGSPIMDMFGKIKINVNLLLYLLNRKFYGKN